MAGLSLLRVAPARAFPHTTGASRAGVGAPPVGRAAPAVVAHPLLRAVAARPRSLPATVARRHEIPARVAVFAFVKPEGQTLRVLVRVPLEAMRDVEWPLHGPGYLDLDPDPLDRLVRNAAQLWIANYLELYEGDVRLEHEQIVTARVSLPSDRSFGDWDDALAHVTGPPLAAGTELVWNQALIDVLFEYPIASASSRFSIRPLLAHLGLRTNTVLHFLAPGHPDRVVAYVGNPGLVRLDPRWHQAVLRFIDLGFRHILSGIDHLLFVLCLVIPFRRFRTLLPIVTAFTVAHSITLIASAAGFAPDPLWFPPLIETLIAASIVYMAFENIVRAASPGEPAANPGAARSASSARTLETPRRRPASAMAAPRAAPDAAHAARAAGDARAARRRSMIAFGFGLVHGFGFSFALRESLQFAGTHVLTSLFAFNVGVELGQLFVLALAIPVLDWLFRRVMEERVGTILLSALIAHTAWHWLLDRGNALRQFRFEWPALDATLLLALLRVLLLLLIAAGVVWLLSGVFGRLASSPDRRSPPASDAAAGAPRPEPDRA